MSEQAAPVEDEQAPPGAASPSLTYEPYYGLSEKPFSLSADPRFLYGSPSHAPAFAQLLAGIRRREGLIVLTGEIGTGKTTLCRAVLQHLDRRTFSTFVPDPFLSREDLLKTLLVDFGVIAIADLKQGRLDGASRPDLSYPLYEFLDSLVPLQSFAVAFIDEAQNLSLPLLEEIRILSELEAREKLLQVVLIGQPELRSKLKLPEMRQLDQRVSVRCELSPLDADTIGAYVTHRLRIAGGGAPRVEFTPDALHAVHRWSGGVPRVINLICDRALQRTYDERAHRVEAPAVLAAVGDLGLDPPANDTSARGGGPLVVPIPPVEARDTTQGGGRRSEESSVATAPGRAADVLSASARPAGRTRGSAAASIAPVERTARDAEAAAAVEGALADFEAETPAPAAPLPRRSDLRPSPSSPELSPMRRVGLHALTILIAALAGTAAGGAWFVYTVLQCAAVDITVMTASAPPPRHWLPAGLPVPSPPSGSPQLSAGASLPAPVRVTNSTAPAGYIIQVASFESRARARRLIGELAQAGYRAHEVELDRGAGRLPLQVVTIDGYATAAAAQPDLERIRRMRGYADARVVPAP